MQAIRKSIRAKLISINIITLVVALLLATIFSYVKAREMMITSSEETLTSLAAASGREIGLWLDGRKSEVATLAATPLLTSGAQKEQLAHLTGEIERNRLYETFFIVDAKGDYVITSGTPANVSDREYYQQAMRGEIVVSDPVISRATGKTVVVVAAPIKRGGKVAGMLGGTVLTDDISRRIANIRAGEQGYAYLVQGDGLTIAHPNQENVMKLNVIKDPDIDARLKEAMTRVTRGETGLSRYVFDNVDAYVAYTPVPGTKWGIAVTQPVAEVFARVRSLPIYAFAVAIIVALLGALAANIFLTRMISRPIMAMEGLMSRAEQGDLTVAGQVQSDDEIGHLIGSFNSFIGKIRQLLLGVQANAAAMSVSTSQTLEVAGRVSKTNAAADTGINAINAAVGKITAGINGVVTNAAETSNHIQVNAAALEEMYGTVHKLAAAAEQIAASVEQVSGSVEKNSDSINNISHSAQDTSASVNSVATAVKEINLSLNEISRNCERSMQITDNAGVRARETTDIIGRLNSSSKQIGKIVNVINDIAEQTKMLALNAAIEAAGAGEAGKGFAVVANEVKELARQTAEATEEIGLQIETMQTGMGGAVTAVGTISQVIDEITENTNTIAAAVTEQSAATGEISRSIVQAAERVNLITREIVDVADHSRHVARNIDEASKGLQDVARSISEMSLAANEATENTTRASDKVSAVAGEVEEISRQATEILGSMQEISLAAGEAAAGAETTSTAARELAQKAGEMEAAIKQFVLQA